MLPFAARGDKGMSASNLKTFPALSGRARDLTQDALLSSLPHVPAGR